MPLGQVSAAGRGPSLPPETPQSREALFCSSVKDTFRQLDAFAAQNKDLQDRCGSLEARVNVLQKEKEIAETVQGSLTKALSQAVEERSEAERTCADAVASAQRAAEVAQAGMIGQLNRAETEARTAKNQLSAQQAASATDKARASREHAEQVERAQNEAEARKKRLRELDEAVTKIRGEGQPSLSSHVDDLTNLLSTRRADPTAAAAAGAAASRRESPKHPVSPRLGEAGTAVSDYIERAGRTVQLAVEEIRSLQEVVTRQSSDIKEKENELATLQGRVAQLKEENHQYETLMTFYFTALNESRLGRQQASAP